MLRRASVVLLGIGAAAAVRAWAGRWGATADEAGASAPGDDIVARPHVQTTHAITVEAAPSRVWPWLVQLGYYRGGWNTDTSWWDFLADRYLRWVVRSEARASGIHHRDEPSADRLLEQYQRLGVGDVLLDGPPGTAFFTVAALQPGRLLALYSDTHARFLFPRALRDNPRWKIGGEFSWVFRLDDAPGHRSRLVVRTRARAWPWAYRAVLTALLPIADGLMSRKMLRGIKHRVETYTRSP